MHMIYICSSMYIYDDEYKADFQNISCMSCTNHTPSTRPRDMYVYVYILVIHIYIAPDATCTYIQIYTYTHI